MLLGIKLLLMLILQLARVYKSLVCFTLYSNDKKMSIAFIKISHYWELLFFALKILREKNRSDGIRRFRRNSAALSRAVKFSRFRQAIWRCNLLSNDRAQACFAG